MARAKGNYEELVRSSILDIYPNSTVTSIVRSDSQGFSSTTYYAELVPSASLVVQVRPESRPLDLENLTKARSIFGSLVPTGSLLKSAKTESDERVLLYRMSRIKGVEINSVLKERSPDILLLIANSLANILAKAIILGTQVTQASQVITVFDQHLELAAHAHTDNPAYQRLKPLFSSLLSRLRAGELQSLPMTFSNDDLSPTNILVQGASISGIVDWECTASYPLGCDAAAVFFLMGRYTASSYTFHSNAQAIEKAFWSSFSAALPVELRSQRASIELALHIALALQACVGGTFCEPWASSLFMRIESRIPQESWKSP